MPKTTRYDSLNELIRRDFEKSVTFENAALTANGQEILVNADHEDWRVDNSIFAQYRPYNALTVDNQSTTTIRVFLDRGRNVFFDVSGGDVRGLDASMYFTYVEIEEQDGAAVSADEVQLTVSKLIDDRELRLLEMSGLLNVGE